MRVYGFLFWLDVCFWMMAVAFLCRMCEWINICVSSNVCPCWWLVLVYKCYFAAVLSIFINVYCVFLCHGWDYRSKSVCYSWVSAIVFAQCLGLSLFVDKRMLWDKWFSTCQSQQKDKRWEKKEVRDEEWNMMEAFRGFIWGAWVWNGRQSKA